MSRFVRTIGLLFTLACAIFFLRSLTDLDLQRLADLPREGLLLTMALSVLLYTALLVAVAVGYGQLVRAGGHDAVRPATAIIVWGRANLAKYLPGNVLHFASRQALAARLGWPQTATAAATLFELALQTALPILIAAAILLSGRSWSMLLYSPWLLPLVGGAMLLLFVAAFGRRLPHWLPAVVRHLPARIGLVRPAALLGVVPHYAVFFAGMSLIAWIFYLLVTGTTDTATMAPLVGAFLMSWLLGFAVPGAPGGIGVREGAFVVLGGPFLDAEALVAVAVAMRAVTLGGEALLFALACWLPWQQTAQPIGARPVLQRVAALGLRRRS